MLSTNLQANSDPLILEQDAVSDSQKACRVALAAGLRSADLPPEETIDYFSAQGAIDRWKALTA